MDRILRWACVLTITPTCFVSAQVESGHSGDVERRDATPCTPVLDHLTELKLDGEHVIGARDADSSPDSIRVSITPYAWLTSYSGDFRVRGISASVQKSFLEILNESDTTFGFMGALDLSVERLVFQLNGAYARAEFDRERGRAMSGPQGGSVEVSAGLNLELEAGWLEALGGYRVVQERWGKSDRKGFTLDVFGGIRYTSLEIDFGAMADATVTLPDGQVLEAGRRVDLTGREEWVEPFVGLAANVSLDENWVVILRGDVGGFGVGNAEFSWQALGLLAYRWRLDGWALSVFAGYRALSQDYKADHFDWDMITHGTVLGFSARFDF